MTKRLVLSVLCRVCLGFHVTWLYAQSFSVRDDISMVRFNDPSESHGDAVATFSPNGKYFVVVTSRGILSSDEIRSTLRVYSSNETIDHIQRSAPPRQLVPRMATTLAAVPSDHQVTAYGAVITELRWAPDSRRIYFLGERSGGDKRIYVVDLRSDKTWALTPKGIHVTRYDFRGDEVVYSGWKTTHGHSETEGFSDGELNPDAFDITGHSIEGILSPPLGLYIPRCRNLWLVHIGMNRSPVVSIHTPCERDVSWLPEAFSLSPSGRMLIRLRSQTVVPNGWTRYQPAPGSEHLRIGTNDPNIVSESNPTRLKEYSLVELGTGRDKTLITAPQGLSLGYTGESEAIWSRDEQSVLLTNTFLPIGDGSGAQFGDRLQPCAIARVQLHINLVQCVLSVADLGHDAPNGIAPRSISFGENDNVVVFRLKNVAAERATRRYVFEHNAWNRTTATPVDKPGYHLLNQPHLTVAIQQTLNDWPTLWRTNTASGFSRIIWDPNPNLRNLRLGEASVLRWSDKTGYQWTGGLVKPVGYTRGRRYPLVIQIYNFDDTRFMTDGMMPTAFAARALASTGILVLQIQRRLPHTFKPEEADTQLDGIESAIDLLVREDLADPANIGLVGFSFSCWYVENALIKAPQRFRAATLADGPDFSYMQSLLWGVSNRTLERQYEQVIGAKPFGPGLKRWFDLASDFSLDRVLTPVRLEAIAPVSLLGEWEIYSSLQMQEKPVDLVYFPDGQHIHQRPLERLESQQGNIDWFRFWLQGYEDSDPAKLDKYKRWEHLRELRDVNQNAVKAQ